MMSFFLSGIFSNANDQWIENVIGVERSIIGNVLNVIRIAGTGIALIALTVMAINYFTADGRITKRSSEEMAKIKGTQLLNFAIGVGIFIGASNLLYFIVTFVEEVITNAV